MPKYHIEVPYTGKIVIELEAKTEEEALEFIYQTPREELEKNKLVSFAEVEEDYHKEVVQGNVFYGVLNRRVVEEFEDDTW